MNYILKELVIGYPGHKVAGPVSATLQGGELCCLLGANGAGKSTLLRTLAAFQPSISGQVYLGDRLLSEIPPRELSTLIGIVLTDRIRTPGLTVRDMVAMGRSPYTNFWGRLTSADHRLVDEAMYQVGITAFANRPMAMLSDGERQKVMIAKALAQGTPVILLDEPTAFLDFPSKVEVMLLLSRLAHEMDKSIFLSTHDLDLALQTADRLWLMRRTASGDSGQPENGIAGTDEHPLFAMGTPRQLATDGILPRFFPSPHVTFDAEELRFRINL
ncbi:MAG: ABC transporter ATP-binding protein [Bacteroidaceae bacterium]|nr:ABC transporter ATP-binding protein [Bacteroidaceae bacterium]